MRRREFVGLLGGAAIWPRSVLAQQPPMLVIGVLSSLAPRDLNFVAPAFHEGLSGAGLVEGRNVSIEYRWAEGDYSRLPNSKEKETIIGMLVNPENPPSVAEGTAVQEAATAVTAI